MSRHHKRALAAALPASREHARQGNSGLAGRPGGDAFLIRVAVPPAVQEYFARPAEERPPSHGGGLFDW